MLVKDEPPFWTKVFDSMACFEDDFQLFAWSYLMNFIVWLILINCRWNSTSLLKFWMWPCDNNNKKKNGRSQSKAPWLSCDTFVLFKSIQFSQEIVNIYTRTIIILYYIQVVININRFLWILFKETTNKLMKVNTRKR